MASLFIDSKDLQIFWRPKSRITLIRFFPRGFASSSPHSWPFYIIFWNLAIKCLLGRKIENCTQPTHYTWWGHWSREPGSRPPWYWRPWRREAVGSHQPKGEQLKCMHLYCSFFIFPSVSDPIYISKILDVFHNISSYTNF